MDTKLDGVVFVVSAPEAKRRKARADRTRGKATSVMLGVLIIIGLSAEWAYSDEPGLEPSLSPETVWVGGIGGGFRKGTFQAGGTVGAGFGIRVFGTSVAHDLALASANLGWVFTDVMARGKWYGGNFELLVELFGGEQFKPNDRYFIGLTPLIRYNFATGSRWVPFVEGGAGVSSTNIDGPDLTGNFQFNIQVGAGIHYFLSDRTALTVQYRWLHFSNADTRLPNNGTNTEMFEVGVSWFF
jgi:opacity protein-like surface antigen